MKKTADPKPLLPRPMLNNPWTPLKLALTGTLLASGCDLLDWFRPDPPLGGIVATTNPAADSSRSTADLTPLAGTPPERSQTPHTQPE